MAISPPTSPRSEIHSPRRVNSDVQSVEGIGWLPRLVFWGKVLCASLLLRQLGISFIWQVSGAFCAISCFLLLIFLFQERLMYVPVVGGFTTVESNPEGYKSPGEYGINFEEFFVETLDGEKIHLWYLPTSNEQNIVLLECHGNAGNMGLRLPCLSATRSQLGVGVCIFDYRGFGSSSGTPSEAGMLKDLDAVFNWLKKRLNGGKIILHGRSVGGSLAVQYAARLGLDKDNNRQFIQGTSLGEPDTSLSTTSPTGLAGVIVENTFVSIADLVDTVFPVLKVVPYFLKDALVRVRWETGSWLKRCSSKIPFLLLSSENDEIAPHSHREELLRIGKMAGLSLEIVTFPNCGHNDLWVTGGSAYWKSQIRWLNMNCKK